MEIPEVIRPQRKSVRVISAEGKLENYPAGNVVVGFAFAGGCGTNNARRFLASTAPQDFPNLYVLVINTDGPQLKEFFDPSAANSDLDEQGRENLTRWLETMEDGKKLTVIQLGESGSGAGGDPEVGRASAESKRKLIQQWMQPLQAVVIAGGAGKGTGGGALPVLQSIAFELDKSPLTIVTMPFSYEGGGRTRKALNALNSLYGRGPTIAIYNENIPRDRAAGKGFRELYDEINQRSIQLVFRGITEVTQIVGDTQNVDIADWRKVLSLGNHVTCSLAEMEQDPKNPEPLNDFIQRLFHEDPYQDHRSRRNSIGMLLWAHGPWNPEELRQIVSAASDGMNATSLEQLEVFSGFHGGNDGRKWMMVLSIAKELSMAAPPTPITVPVTEDLQKKTLNMEMRTVIHLPSDAPNELTTARVTPDVAERWNRLFPRHYRSMSQNERREYDMLIDIIRKQTGIAIRAYA